MFIERISTPRIKKNGEISAQYNVVLRYQRDFCKEVYERRPANASHSSSGLTFCSRKCRGRVDQGRKGRIRSHQEEDSGLLLRTTIVVLYSNGHVVDPVSHLYETGLFESFETIGTL